MDKRMAAKEAQGYRDQGPMCSNCANYKCRLEASGWSPDWTIEKEKRCGLGGFAIKKTSWCENHQFAKE